MSKQAFLIFRAAKLKQGRGSGSFARSWKHLENHDIVGLKMHPERAEHNQTRLHPRVIENGLKAVLDGIKKKHNEVAPRALRKDAPIGVELLFSYSQNDANGKPIAFDLQFIEQYEAVMSKVIKEHFPSFKALRFDRHCDESSVHWHIVGTCIDDRGRICIKDALGGPNNMARLQTVLAKSFEHLGLRRGIAKPTLAEEEQRHHTTKREWLRLQALSREERERYHNDLFESLG